MKAKINVDQNTALQAGKDTYGDIVIDFDPAELSPAQRAEIATCCLDNDKAYDVSYVQDSLPGIYIDKIACADVTALISILDERIAKKSEAKANTIKFLKAKAIEDLAEYKKSTWSIGGLTWQLICEHNLLSEDKKKEVDNYLAQAAKVYAEKEKKRIAKEKAEQKTREEKRQADESESTRIANEKAEQISAWVAEHGTENQQKRKELDLLEDEEVINAIREEIFAPLADYARYEKLRSADVCECEDRYEGYCDVDYDVYDCKATVEEFEKMQEIQKLIPEAKITIKEHTGESEDCENTEKRKSLHVAIQAGAFTFSREYAI